jgi:hypothetical protein
VHARCTWFAKADMSVHPIILEHGHGVLCNIAQKALLGYFMCHIYSFKNYKIDSCLRSVCVELQAFSTMYFDHAADTIRT